MQAEVAQGENALVRLHGSPLPPSPQKLETKINASRWTSGIEDIKDMK